MFVKTFFFLKRTGQEELQRCYFHNADQNVYHEGNIQFMSKIVLNPYQINVKKTYVGFFFIFVFLVNCCKFCWNRSIAQEYLLKPKTNIIISNILFRFVTHVFYDIFQRLFFVRCSCQFRKRAAHSENVLIFTKKNQFFVEKDGHLKSVGLEPFPSWPLLRAW